MIMSDAYGSKAATGDALPVKLNLTAALHAPLKIADPVVYWDSVSTPRPEHCTSMNGALVS